MFCRRSLRHKSDYSCFSRVLAIFLHDQMMDDYEHVGCLLCAALLDQLTPREGTSGRKKKGLQHMIGVNEGSSLFQAASHSCRSLSEETTTKNMEKKDDLVLGVGLFCFFSLYCCKGSKG